VVSPTEPDHLAEHVGRVALVEVGDADAGAPQPLRDKGETSDGCLHLALAVGVEDPQVGVDRVDNDRCDVEPARDELESFEVDRQAERPSGGKVNEVEVVEVCAGRRESRNEHGCPVVLVPDVDHVAWTAPTFALEVAAGQPGAQVSDESGLSLALPPGDQGDATGGDAVLPHPLRTVDRNARGARQRHQPGRDHLVDFGPGHRGRRSSTRSRRPCSCSW
jgi:hypothetical protein